MNEQKPDMQGGVVDQAETKPVIPGTPEYDQARIAEWHKRNAESATAEDIRKAKNGVTEAEAALAKAERKLAAAAGKRALVHGFTEVAAEVGVSAKRVHQWRREHAASLSDISSVPHKEMQREQRRVEDEEQRIAQVESLRARVLERKARLAGQAEENGEQK